MEKDKIQYAFDTLRLESIEKSDIDKLAGYANKKLIKTRLVSEKESNHTFIKSEKPFVKVCKRCGMEGYEYHPKSIIFDKTNKSDALVPAPLGMLYLVGFNVHCNINLLAMGKFKEQKIRLLYDMPHLDINFKKGKLFTSVPCPENNLEYINDIWVYGKERKAPCRLLNGEYEIV